jgi:cytochrome b
LPTRIFHWLLAALILFSWWSVKNDHTDWHIWSGIAILTSLIFRLLWGFFGSSTARFANFVRGPASIRDYLRGRWKGAGHTPLGALSVVAMLIAVAMQVGLGLVSQDDDGIYMGPLARLVSSRTSDLARDLHEEWFEFGILPLLLLHVAAIAFYRLKGRHLIKPMITGRAFLDPAAQPMRPGRWWAALLCLGLAFAISRWVVAGAPPFGP